MFHILLLSYKNSGSDKLFCLCMSVSGTCACWHSSWAYICWILHSFYKVPVIAWGPFKYLRYYVCHTNFKSVRWSWMYCNVSIESDQNFTFSIDKSVSWMIKLKSLTPIMAAFNSSLDMVRVLIGASLDLAMTKLQQTDLSLNSNIR